MTLNAVVGQQPAHIRMAGKEHTVEVVGFALVPVGTGEDADDRGDRRCLIGLDLHAESQILLGRQEMVDDIEAPVAARPVYCCDIDKAPELASLIVAQKADDLHDIVADRADRQLSVGNAVPCDRAWKGAGDNLAEFVEPIIHCAIPITARSRRCGGSSSLSKSPPTASPLAPAGSRARNVLPGR